MKNHFVRNERDLKTATEFDETISLALAIAIFLSGSMWYSFSWKNCSHSFVFQWINKNERGFDERIYSRPLFIYLSLK